MKRFTLAHGIVVSLLLNACLILPLLMWMTRPPRKYLHNMNQLNIELFGMLSNRQVQAQQRRIEKARQSEPTAKNSEIAEPKPQAAPEKTVPPEPQSALSERVIDMRDAVRLPVTLQAPGEKSDSLSSQPRSGGDSDQRQQFIGKGNGEADLISAYVAQLTKQVNAHLIYPSEVKKKRLEGVSWVSFVVTTSGEIKPNTLTIKKSSGYAALDANALKTITATAPFQRPPRELTVSFAIDFAVDR